MSTIHYPDDFDIDYHSDLQWQRQQRALQSLTVSDILAEVDALIASESAPENHPLYAMTAAMLGHATQPGTAEGLWSRYRQLIDHCIEKLVEQKLVDVGSWEVD